ncbi:MAG: hypothetical protein ACTS3F_00215 [Phycisphaerales bacterium]
MVPKNQVHEREGEGSPRAGVGNQPACLLREDTPESGGEALGGDALEGVGRALFVERGGCRCGCSDQTKPVGQVIVDELGLKVASGAKGHQRRFRDCVAGDCRAVMVPFACAGCRGAAESIALLGCGAWGEMVW